MFLKLLKGICNQTLCILYCHLKQTGFTVVSRIATANSDQHLELDASASFSLVRLVILYKANTLRQIFILISWHSRTRRTWMILIHTHIRVNMLYNTQLQAELNIAPNVCNTSYLSDIHTLTTSETKSPNVNHTFLTH